MFTAAMLLLCAGVCALADRLRDGIIHAAAAATALAVTVGCCVLAACAHAYPDADQIYVYEAASNFFSGQYTNIQTEWYFNACPYQLGLGLLYGIIMRSCGRDSYFVLQCAQAVCAGVTVYGAYLLTWKLFKSKRASVMVLLCMAVFAPMYLYTLYLYGETFGLCFAVLGMLFWLLSDNKEPEKKKITALYRVLSVLCFILCYTARPALVIVMLALAVTGLLKVFTDRSWRPLGLAALILLLSLAGQKLAVAYMERQADVELAEGMPAILTVAMGIQDEDVNGTGPGSYNAYNLWLYFGCGFDGDSASSEAFLNIKQTLYQWYQQPARMISYLEQKVLNQWNEATYGGFFMTAKQREPKPWVEELYAGAAGDRWYAFLDLYQGALYAVLLIYFILLLGGKRETAFYLPGLLLVGEFCFSVIWEAKSRYIYPYIVMALPCAAWSLTYCAGRITGGITGGKGRGKEEDL